MATCRPGWRAPVTTRFSLSLTRLPFPCYQNSIFFFPLTFGVGRHGSRLYNTRCLSAHPPPPPPMSKRKWRFSILRIVTGRRGGGDGVAPKTKARKKIRRKKNRRKNTCSNCTNNRFVYMYILCVLCVIIYAARKVTGPALLRRRYSVPATRILLLLLLYTSHCNGVDCTA